MEMERAQHGVDYHDDGADVGWGLKLALLALMGTPVLMVAYLIVSNAR